MRCANIPLPLPRFRLLLAASRIHMTAVRLRCRSPRGDGTCNATPPPAAPLMERIFSNGATESIASVKYSAGFRGRCVGGGAPGRSGLVGLMTGGGEVLRCSSINPIFCHNGLVPVTSIQSLCKPQTLCAAPFFPCSIIRLVTC